MPAPTAPRPAAQEPPRPRLLRLAGLAAVELLVAWLLAQGLIRLGRLLSARSAAEPEPLQGAHGGHGQGGGTAGAHLSPVTGTVTLAVACALAVTVWLTRRRGGGDEWRLLAVIAIVVVAFLPVAQAAAGASHLAMMIRLMLLLVIAPSLLASLVYRHRRAPAAVVRRLAIPAALGYALIMLLWHLPTPATGPGSALFALLTFAAGVALWVGVLGDPDPVHATPQRVAVYLAGIPAGLIGLALILAGEPILPGHPHAGAGLSAVADQRAGGLLMMIVEAIFLLPVLTRAARPASS
ncbi:cytochrome c oxidase assembly protein [Nocardia harenae]|uniref:cytochrome c oxidase assembly protein n=1 Tax=Nocardia harenae TaxID=358707 RepID=UPI000836105B|nr:cytochrome c oxidase assembly protein [Nocardia harenae]